MLKKESSGNGDQMNAYERVAARCGMTARQLRRFLSGEIKEPAWGFIHGIRIGWFGLWEEEVRKMQHEMDIYRKRFASDRFQDLKAQIEALAAEAQALSDELQTRKKDISQ
ncbi:hypothetical protein SJ05684_c10320 [Sinorhizobium sojae CCBAU 05684]|uniref:Uncharacterized protein n=2 Tax=Sinorhizobium sojae TaxID=716925 RepID=A0A249P984_9HYPH|nr:hypothetical protein SJ05684_c10320 [Sinorhizobium sojae CCBAU 05684]